MLVEGQNTSSGGKKRTHFANGSEKNNDQKNYF